MKKILVLIVMVGFLLSIGGFSIASEKHEEGFTSEGKWVCPKWKKKCRY